MAFRLKVDESVKKGVRRIVRREIDGALDELTGRDGDSRDEAVHDARKRFKKVRAVLRLVRDELGAKAYRRENHSFRDAARPLTEVRDAKVLVDTLDKLAKQYAGQLSADEVDRVRQQLQADRRAVRTRVLDTDGALGRVADAVEGARARLKDWPIKHRGWQALRGGLKRVYGSGRRAFTTAAADPTDENLHELRKQAKYLRHQLEVLEPVWPEIMKDFAGQVHELGDLLGDDHDLAVLRQTLAGDPERFGGAPALDPVFGLIERRRHELREAGLALGRRIYHDTTGNFVAGIRDYWRAWRSETAAARPS
jgi:CHAD domain-containing protein